MPKSALLAACLLSTLLLTGCLTDSATNPISVKAAIDNVENNIRSAAPLIATDLAAEGQARAEAARHIANAQCYYKSNNPIIGVLTKDFTLQLAGTFTVTGSGTGIILPIPGAGVGFSVAQGKTQTISVPITFVTLENVPNVYFSTNVAYFASAPDTKKATEINKLWETRGKIMAAIQTIMANPPDFKTCKSDDPTIIQPTFQ